MMTTTDLPTNPAHLVAHLAEAHGWAPQGYDPSMMQAHRTAHGADLPTGPVDLYHRHDFVPTRAFWNRWNVGLVVLAGGSLIVGFAMGLTPW